MESRAILRDDGMGKLCLESCVPLSRQRSPADVGRGIRRVPEGKRASHLADAWALPNGAGRCRPFVLHPQSVAIVAMQGACSAGRAASSAGFHSQLSHRPPVGLDQTGVAVQAGPEHPILKVLSVLAHGAYRVLGPDTS